MPQIFINNARGVLAESVPSGETTLKLKNVAHLPASLNSDDWFLMTIFNDGSRYGSNVEVVKVTDITDEGSGRCSLTVERGYEGAAIVHAAGEKAEARITAQTLRTILDEAQAYADSKISKLIGDAPEALDTLVELAEALDGDPDFANTITNELSKKLNADSYTAEDVLEKILTVDGHESGLDADTLDGEHLEQVKEGYRLHAAAVTPSAFTKADSSRPAWSVAGSNALRTASALALIVGGALVEIPADTDVTLPSLSAGTDYTIYAADDGTLQAVDADSAAPANTRAVGGFHASAGGGAIVSSSLWDLNWRPSAPSPRGMVLSLDKRTWADIYLVDVDYALHGYSRNGQRIADGNSLPKIPAEYGGNGSATYDSGSWWTFNDILSAAGKRFPFYQEFTALAYGVVERQAVGTDPVTTQHQAGYRSACGCEQVTGVMYQWGADINGTSATGDVAWQDWADGRGDIYTNSIRAPRFGAAWFNGSYSGSRASAWSSQPDLSLSDIGARGVCDHMNLQAER